MWVCELVALLRCVGVGSERLRRGLTTLHAEMMYEGVVGPKRCLVWVPGSKGAFAVFSTAGGRQHQPLCIFCVLALTGVGYGCGLLLWHAGLLWWQGASVCSAVGVKHCTLFQPSTG